MLAFWLWLGFFYFVLNSPTLAHNVTCSRLYLGRKNIWRQCQMNILFRKTNFMWSQNLVIHIWFDSLVNIWLINKETCEYQRVTKISFLEIFDLLCIYLTKLRCRPSLKSLQTFIIIIYDMNLCCCSCFS